ncbi:MAG: hypothetical protein JWP75_2824 [Frondihabitans sp.]|nr:hypothetical protein [Frondihabitans sp.]
MTVLDNRTIDSIRLKADTGRTPMASGNQVGWVSAFVWPAVGTALVAGSLLGAHGLMLFWAGVIGSLAMFVRQVIKLAARKVRDANLVIDNAPGRFNR